MNTKKFHNKISAFTLSEVLITLGIIGIVAAMTIPNLMTKINEKRTITTLKATQSIIAQTIRMAEEEYGDASAWTKERWTEKGAQDIAEKLRPFIKIAIDCGTNDKTGKCVPVKYKYKNGTNSEIAYATDKRYYKIVLLNGSALWWKATDPNDVRENCYIQFFVDTNGTNLPNEWGRDLFVFSYENNSIRPLGAPDSTKPYTEYCLPANAKGWGCAYYVLHTQSMKY